MARVLVPACALDRAQNIMLKKALDICVGGLSFAVFGYGLGFGVAPAGVVQGVGNRSLLRAASSS